MAKLYINYENTCQKKMIYLFSKFTVLQLLLSWCYTNLTTNKLNVDKRPWHVFQHYKSCFIWEEFIVSIFFQNTSTYKFISPTQLFHCYVLVMLILGILDLINQKQICWDKKTCKSASIYSNLMTMSSLYSVTRQM